MIFCGHSPSIIYARYSSQQSTSFTGDNGFAVFVEALRTIAQTYEEAKNVITRYLDNKLPNDAEQAIEPSKPEKALEDTTGWDLTLIEMWNKGHSRDEIANRVNVSKDRVTNRVTELRNKFGEDIVPYHKDRKKRLIKS